jgi:hypothetical protein
MTTLDPTKEQWCWASDGEEEAHGPCDSKAAAINAASNALGHADIEIMVARCRPFQPELWVDAIGGDMSDVIERMEAFAADNGWIDDGDLFGDDKPGAEEALHATLVAWAREYLTSTAWSMADDYTREMTYDVNAATGETA